MQSGPKAPTTYEAFVQRYPALTRAWESLGAAGREAPLDARTVRLIKLGLVIVALREGAVHANVRKALADGITREEIDQVLALAAGTIGLPATVAVFSWVEDALSGP
jgi:alkylhydroperoxidase/carboxymuconolactone decarboxylase family protein YurZ